MTDLGVPYAKTFDLQYMMNPTYHQQLLTVHLHLYVDQILYHQSGALVEISYTYCLSQKLHFLLVDDHSKNYVLQNNIKQT